MMQPTHESPPHPLRRMWLSLSTTVTEDVHTGSGPVNDMFVLTHSQGGLESLPTSNVRFMQPSERQGEGGERDGVGVADKGVLGVNDRVGDEGVGVADNGVLGVNDRVGDKGVKDVAGV